MLQILSISSRVNSRVQFMFKISRHSPVDVYYKLTNSARLSLISSRSSTSHHCNAIDSAKQQSLDFIQTRLWPAVY